MDAMMVVLDAAMSGQYRPGQGGRRAMQGLLTEAISLGKSNPQALKTMAQTVQQNPGASVQMVSMDKTGRARLSPQQVTQPPMQQPRGPAGLPGEQPQIQSPTGPAGITPTTPQLSIPPGVGERQFTAAPGMTTPPTFPGRPVEEDLLRQQKPRQRITADDVRRMYGGLSR
jgi:hypothetical protein